MKFRDYINESKPKKGDYIQDVRGEIQQIDIVSKGVAYTKGRPMQGSELMERDPFFIKYLKSMGKHKGKNLWSDTVWDLEII